MLVSFVSVFFWFSRERLAEFGCFFSLQPSAPQGESPLKFQIISTFLEEFLSDNFLDPELFSLTSILDHEESSKTTQKNKYINILSYL